MHGLSSQLGTMQTLCPPHQLVTEASQRSCFGLVTRSWLILEHFWEFRLFATCVWVVSHEDLCTVCP